GVRRTGLFIGGRETWLAVDMLDSARRAMVPPFEVSVLVDPSGAFTTAAAMIAAVEKQLQKAHACNLAGKTVMIFGGSGPVGAAAAVLAAQAGANVAIVAREDPTRARNTAQECNRRYGTRIEAVEASTVASKKAMMQRADIVLATAKAGHRVVGKALLVDAKALLVAADVNAVPPSGIEGLDAMDGGKPLQSASDKAVGIGALAIGNIKYQTQRGLLKAMLEADKALYLNLPEALQEARKHAAIA
ncbi:MAG: methylene-tetrahydromethanopterin dehydrogenase N-terminal domain-containing protein, partial [Burkholderiales bacterium]